MRDAKRTKGTLLSVSLILASVLLLGAFAMIAIGPAAANHGADQGNYTIVLPEPSDHLPGDQNEENASMQNFASAGARFEQEGAPNGFETLDYLETGTPEIDYSNCNSENTAVFGVDRGNNNTGTKTDTDLLEHMKASRFKENKIEVDFYEESDFGGDPTYLNPEDAIVSVQGAGSQGGPCFTMPTEPGWYQVNGLVRGTTEDGDVVEVETISHYFPICEGCQDNETAYDKLGPPPSQRDDSDGSDDGGDATPTPTATATATPTPEQNDEATATATATPTPEDDDGDDGGDGGSESTEQDDSNESSGESDSSSSDESNATPTPGAGPGFSTITALLALLAVTLIARRR